MADSKQLDTLEAQLKEQRNFDTPPLHLWHPELSGDIPIHINAEGTWFHDGGEIRREALVRLFASILRREEDGQYYLVTPVEKWRIDVQLHPLVVVDFTIAETGQGAELTVELNTGKKVLVNAEHPIVLDSTVGDIAVVSLWHGLSAIFSRAAWLRLVEAAHTDGDSAWVESGGQRFSLTDA